MTIGNWLKQSKKNYQKLEKVLGVKFDYTPRSIRNIEISCKLRINHYPDIKLIAILGFYFGEVIVKNIKESKWLEVEEGDNNLGNVSIGIENKENKIIIFPIIRVDKFFKSNEDLFGFYQFLLNSLNEDILVGKDNQWIESSKGYSYRKKEVTEEMLNNNLEIKNKINKIKKFQTTSQFNDKQT